MKITYIELLGKKYPLCFSLAASGKLSEAFGDLNKMQEKLSGGNVADIAKTVDTMLDILMDAGRKYCKIAGMDAPEALKCNPSDLIDLSDPTALTAIFSAISAGNEREVEVSESKNTEAAPMS